MISEYVERVNGEAEELVEHLPQKILDLVVQLKSDKFNRKNLKELHSKVNIPPPNPTRLRESIMATEISRDSTKPIAFPNGAIPSNTQIVELVDILKPLYQGLVDDANMLKNWLQLLIPRIEDGNNFGVSIQETVLDTIGNTETDAKNYFVQIVQYFTNRAKIVSKLAKFPNVDDYRKAIQDMDEKEYIYLRMYMSDLVEHYTTLHDKITKNLEKIKKPRGETDQTFTVH